MDYQQSHPEWTGEIGVTDDIFKQFSEFIGRRIIDNDGLNEQREGAGWLKLNELLQFLQ